MGMICRGKATTVDECIGCWVFIWRSDLMICDCEFGPVWVTGEGPVLAWSYWRGHTQMAGEGSLHSWPLPVRLHVLEDSPICFPILGQEKGPADWRVWVSTNTLAPRCLTIFLGRQFMVLREVCLAMGIPGAQVVLSLRGKLEMRDKGVVGRQAMS